MKKCPILEANENKNEKKDIRNAFKVKNAKLIWIRKVRQRIAPEMSNELIDVTFTQTSRCVGKNP